MPSLTSVENPTTNGMPVMVPFVRGQGPSIVFPSPLISNNPHEPFMYGFAGGSLHLSRNFSPDPRLKCAFFFGSLAMLPASPLYRQTQVEIHERVFGEEGGLGNDENGIINHEAWGRTWQQFENTLELITASRNGTMTSTARIQVFLVSRTQGHFFTSFGKLAQTTQQLAGFIEPYICSNLIKWDDVRGTELDGSGNMAQDELIQYDGIVVLLQTAMVISTEFIGVHSEHMFYDMLRDMYVDQVGVTEWVIVGQDTAAYELARESNGVGRYSIMDLNVFAATRRIENIMKTRFDMIGAALWPDGLALSQKLTPSEWNELRGGPLVEQLENEITSSNDPEQIITTIRSLYEQVNNGRSQLETVTVPVADVFTAARRLAGWMSNQAPDVQIYAARFSPVIWAIRRYQPFVDTSALLNFLHSNLQYLDVDGIDGDDANINAVNVVLWPLWPFILHQRPDGSPANNIVYDTFATQIVNALWDQALFSRFISNERLWIPLNGFRVEWLISLDNHTSFNFIDNNTGRLASIASELR